MKVAPTVHELNIPDDTLLSLKLSDAAADEIRLVTSVKLYELGRLSSGAAARLAGLPRVLFLSKLDDYGVDTFRRTGVGFYANGEVSQDRLYGYTGVLTLLT